MFCSNCGVALYEGAASCSACGRPASAESPQAAPGKVAYAGFWLRLVAAAIDSVVTAIPTFAVLVFAVVFFGLQLPPADAVGLDALPTPGVFILLETLFLGIHWLYFALMESSGWQGTLGKRALGLGVSDLNGKRISFGRASGRFFGKILSNLTLLVGYVMAGFTEKKQALHDIIAECLVVRMP